MHKFDGKKRKFWFFFVTWNNDEIQGNAMQTNQTSLMAENESNAICCNRHINQIMVRVSEYGYVCLLFVYLMLLSTFWVHLHCTRKCKFPASTQFKEKRKRGQCNLYTHQIIRIWKIRRKKNAFLLLNEKKAIECLYKIKSSAALSSHCIGTTQLDSITVQ